MTHVPEPSTDAVEPPAPGAVAADGDLRPHWKRDVGLFLTGQTITLFGSMIVQYAVMWHLTLETRSGGVMALAALFGFLPQAIVSIFGGVWADRLNRKVLIIAADAAIAVTTLGLALVLLTGYDGLWLIYLTLAIRSVGAGIQTPAVSALVPQLTPPDQLMRVNGILGSVQSAMALIAPAAAGVIYATASLVSIFFVDVVTAAIGIALLVLVPVRAVARSGERTSYFGDLVEGVRYVATHTFVRWLLVLFAIIFLLTVAPSYLTPLMVARTFADADFFGLDDVAKLTALEIAFSVGMVLGGIVIAAWGGTKNKVTMIVVSSVLFGLLSIALGLSTNIWVFYGFMFLVGLAVPFFSTPSMTLLQLRVEPERQGRVFGFVGIVMAVSMPIGMVIFGPLADVWSIESLLVIAGAITFAVVAIAVLVPAGRRAWASGRVEQPVPDGPRA